MYYLHFRGEETDSEKSSELPKAKQANNEDENWDPDSRPDDESIFCVTHSQVVS